MRKGEAGAQSRGLWECQAPRPSGRDETGCQKWDRTGLNDSGSSGDLQVLLEKEPQDTLCTSTRQQTIHIISSLW